MLTHTALLAHPDLTLQARQAHLFLGLTKALLYIGALCEHRCEATFNDKLVHIKNKQSGNIILRGKRDARTNLYMLIFTKQKKLITESTTRDEYFAGRNYEFKSKSILVDYHHTYFWSPTHSGLGKAITKNFFTSWTGLSMDLVNKHLTKNNQPYLGTPSNRERAYYQHKKMSCIQNQIQSNTSSHNPLNLKTPIFSSSRQWIFLEKFIRTKQEGSQ